jgi:RHS repeat-associated protein
LTKGYGNLARFAPPPSPRCFGNVLSESNTTAGDRFKFTGRELDSETGLQYNRARYYDAVHGRWTTQDPLAFKAGDPELRGG